MLTGLRGVGKTVLLNALRSAAVRAHWGTGKLEARPDQGLRRPLQRRAARRRARARTPAGRRRRPRARRDQGLRPARRRSPDAKLRDRWQPGIDAPAVSGRADSGDIEIDLVELLTDIGGLAADVGKGVAIFIDEMQDLGPDDVSALCAACHEISQSGLPLIVVGAGLPHLPAVLSASKSYSERLFAYSRIDRLDRAAADRALQSPAREEDADFTPEALEAMYAATAGYPYFVQAYGKVAWDVAPGQPHHAPTTCGSPRPRPRPSSRSASSGRATSGPRRPSGSTCGRWPTPRRRGPRGRGARAGSTRPSRCRPPRSRPMLDRKPQSLSPARDALLKKGLIYTGERGRIAFTVPHFGRYLRANG